MTIAIRTVSVPMRITMESVIIILLSVSARQEPVLTVRVPDITETITREIIRTVKTVPAVITQDTTDK